MRRGLARLAARMRRAEATIEFAVAAARAALAPGAVARARARSSSRRPDLTTLPAEVALRLLGRAIAHAGNEGPVELGKLELLYAGATDGRVRRCAGRWPVRWSRCAATDWSLSARRRAEREPCAAPATAALRNDSSNKQLARCRPSLGRGRSDPYIARDTGREAATICGHKLAAGRRRVAGRGHAMNANLRNFALWVIIVLLLLGAVHAVPESGPAHHLARHFVFAIAQRGRPGPRARRADPGPGNPRHLHRRPQLPDLFAERPDAGAAALQQGRFDHGAAADPRTCPGSCRC